VEDVTIHIGITGSREGCSVTRLRELMDVMSEFAAPTYPRLIPDSVVFHFGDCTGVDFQGFHLAKVLEFQTTAHPPTNPTWRAYCDADQVLPEKPYMERNRDIVNAVSTLIVVPSGPEADNPRSGTWATYRMAVKAGVETVVIEP
jgi:hypothetical protein